jgi:hypothetical protein
LNAWRAECHSRLGEVSFLLMRGADPDQRDRVRNAIAGELGSLPIALEGPGRLSRRHVGPAQELPEPIADLGRGCLRQAGLRLLQVDERVAVSPGLSRRGPGVQQIPEGLVGLVGEKEMAGERGGRDRRAPLAPALERLAGPAVEGATAGGGEVPIDHFAQDVVRELDPAGVVRLAEHTARR